MWGFLKRLLLAVLAVAFLFFIIPLGFEAVGWETSAAMMKLIKAIIAAGAVWYVAAGKS